MKAAITFLGGAETGNVADMKWGPLVFRIDKPLIVDSEAVAPEHRLLVEHIIAKAKQNRFFKVEDVPEAKAPPAPTSPPKPAGPKPAARRK